MANRGRKKFGEKRGRKPGNRTVDPGYNDATKARLDLLQAAGISPAHFATPIDGLQAMGKITERQQRAGQRYAAVRAASLSQLTTLNPGILNWGNLVPPEVSADATPIPTNDMDPKTRQAEYAKDYAAADFVLRQAGSRSHTEVQNVCCYFRWPPIEVWKNPMRIVTMDRDLVALKDGLTALANHWRLPKQRVDGTKKAA